MHTCHAVGRPLPEAVCSSRELLSLREVVILADVSEKRVRKDIETGILAKPLVVRLPDARLCFEWHHVFIVAAVYGNALLNGSLRKAVFKKIDDIVRADLVIRDSENSMHFVECKTYRKLRPALALDRYLSLDLEKVCHSIKPRMDMYSHGLNRIEEKEDVLGGEAVFKGTRLSVPHIGKMVVDGESMTNIIEDYPSLNEYDVRFAELYYRAHPTIGRPKIRGDRNDATSCA